LGHLLSTAPQNFPADIGIELLGIEHQAVEVKSDGL
jgi:hypothetical protein